MTSLRDSAPSPDPQFRECLRHARERAGWTQEELAERAGLSANAISALERGERRFPHLPTVRALADALGLSDEAKAALIAVVPSRRDRPNVRTVAVPHAPTLRDSLIGRERELEAVRVLLIDEVAPIVTLVGPPGVGKTRLAQSVASAVSGHFPDGALYIPLAPVRDAELVAAAIATALGLQMRDGSLPIDAIIRSLQTSHQLLVLDNFEHVIATAHLVAQIVAGCPHAQVLVTSREVLRVTGEQVFPLSPLALPGSSPELNAEQISESSAVRLFITRARAVQPEFALTDANASKVATLCGRLDGLPLAIELAAARTSVLSPDAMLQRLNRHGNVLAAGSRDAPDRHKSLTEAIAWSYDLLTPDEQALLRQLSVFVGGFTFDGVEAVAGVEDVLTGIASLVDKSLVRRLESAGDEPRFDLLETIREFGLARLGAHGTSHETHLRHIEYFVTVAESLSIGLEWNPDPAPAQLRLKEEDGNFEAALTWASESGENLPFCRLAAALQKHWADSGRFREGLRWLEIAERIAPELPTAVRAAVLDTTAWMARCLGDSDRAWSLAEASLELAQGLNDVLATMNALTTLAHVAEDRGNHVQARELYRELLVLSRPLNHPFWTGFAIAQAGWTAFLCGDLEEAERLSQEALEYLPRSVCPYGRALALSIQANIARARGESLRAAELCHERLNLPADTWSLRWSLEELADTAVDLGEMERAARLLGASEALRERMGIILVPSRIQDYEASVSSIRAALSEKAFTAAWQEGRAMSDDEARAEASLVGREETPSG